jgi:hypothetical protein
VTESDSAAKEVVIVLLAIYRMPSETESFRRSLASVGSTGGANKNLHTATVRTTHPLKPSLDPEVECAKYGYGLVGLLGGLEDQWTVLLSDFDNLQGHPARNILTAPV